MIEINNLKVSVGKFFLREINLIIKEGIKHVIVGPTGSGKTLLLETILGIKLPQEGRVILNGVDITKLPPYQRNITYVPQDVCLFPHMTVRENIEYGCTLKFSKISDEYKIYIDNIIELLKLNSLLDRYPDKLSGGEKQRVAIARALAIKPMLIVLDEPFSSIDFSFREDLRREVKNLFETFNTTALIVTHDLDEAFFLADRLSILIDGEIIQTGTREEIFYYPKTVKAAKFLGIKNIFEGKVKSLENNIISIYSEDFKFEFNVPCKCALKRFTINENIYFGFRPEAITLLEKLPNGVTNGNNNIDIIYNDEVYYIKSRIKNFYIRGSKHTGVAEYTSLFDSNKKVLVELDLLDRNIIYNHDIGKYYYICIPRKNIFLLKS